MILRGLEQLPLSAVGDRLDIEPGTAAVRFHRALKHLQKRLPESVFADLEVAET